MKRLLTLLVLTLTVGAAFGQSGNLWEFWDQSDPGNDREIDHGEWQQFLDEYLVTDTASGVNLVRYGDVTSADRRQLQGYLAALERVPVRSLAPDVQLAYWLNLYNALTIEVILEAYPVNSIRDINISPGLFSRGPWGAKLVEVEGEELSLDDIEHRILRPIWQDPRIHYGVNCASVGCPNLQSAAFTAENVDGLLTKGAREYVNHPRGVTISVNRATVSSIYTWFQEDFGGNTEGVIAHLQRYAEPELRQELESVSTRLRFEYDWSLNEP